MPRENAVRSTSKVLAASFVATTYTFHAKTVAKTLKAIFALEFGLYTHVAPLPQVAGAPRLVKLLTTDCKSVHCSCIELGDTESA